MSTVVGAFAAKSGFSRLLRLVEQGETVIITKHEHPVAKLVPVEADRKFDVEAARATLARIRAHTKPGPGTIKDLIEEGRKW